MWYVGGEESAGPVGQSLWERTVECCWPTANQAVEMQAGVGREALGEGGASHTENGQKSLILQT